MGYLSGTADAGPSAIRSAPDPLCESAPTVRRHANRPDIYQRSAKSKNRDKVERFRVVDFDRVDMPRWNDVASYEADNAANGTTKADQGTIRSGDEHENRPGHITRNHAWRRAVREIPHGSACHWVMT